MKNKIACILNYAPHYRSTIYSLMDQYIGCDFYFGANLRKRQILKKMDTTSLKGFKRESTVYFFRYRWQCGYPWFAFKNYEAFILTGDASLSNLFFVQLCKIFKKKVFLWGHGIKTEPEMHSLPLRSMYHNADGFFLYGDYGKLMMKRFGIPEEKLFVVYNSLNYETQIRLRAVAKHSSIFHDHFSNNYPVVLFTGRLMPGKQLHMIIDSQRIANASGQPFNIVYVGDGPEKQILKKIAATVAEGALTWFFGECFDESKLSELFYNADVCVSPGNVGLTAIHSLTYGTPVVSHDDMRNQGPEAEAIIEGISGGFFKKDDVYDLWINMKRWFYKSTAVRAQIRQKCYRVIDEKYNPHYQLKVMRRALRIS